MLICVEEVARGNISNIGKLSYNREGKTIFKMH